jgi:hypothetical protein
VERHADADAVWGEGVGAERGDGARSQATGESVKNICSLPPQEVAADDSPGGESVLPGEGRVSRVSANATSGCSGWTVTGAGLRSAAVERPGQTKNSDEGHAGA